MSVRAIERRKLRKVGNSFVTALIHRELQEEGLIEKNGNGEWELVDDETEVVVEHRTDDVRVRLPSKE